ncbi:MULTISPECIES: serine--tRNA ligase [unclassified Gordonia (in: high G+C Gram-positive bacteria)]|uniref:serine--tRNA ligase n=1 Tax=unclassified Gordonia (in: high G+C Gram-positive bacteria) TaxID=2657482 RepID=UPI0007E93A86|nr:MULTISPECIES: serine--tRNA ligase [unclassified Gordonia (in: high G+C Gram-positive bacteria)]OBC08690.1 serine--tRNA ligase [Gordonia sp. 852002-50395_SCH5434458]OBC10434.1 serine--tRNA ligase [Gordonia sp. 852002-50816_SCH5313054-a]OBC20236.1 serine--tRNA ligase [Gordonia sp. 852002-50816_SCH5313054-c]
MIDLKIVRDDPNLVRASQRVRGEDPGLVDVLLDADSTRRSAIVEADSLRSEQKALGKQVGKASGDEKAALLAKGKELADQVKAAVARQNEADEAASNAQRAISNIVEGAPPGGEDDYVVLEHVGQPREIENPKDHLELGESLGLIDMERGAKVSGSRFYFLTGQGAMLQLGLLTMAAQKATANGFTLMIPPVLVRPEVMGGTGFLGAHADEVYHLDKDDDLYLVGTSEVPLAGYHMDEIIDLSDGPKRYAGWSTCFRREAGSYGKDTRGIIRVHQFDKVEGFVYCKPEDAAAEHQKLLGWEKEMLAAIDVPYRVIDVAGGDLGSSAARKFDCEAWVPTQQTYRELTSTSNCTTFQARRLSIRYRDESGKPQVAATLNGTLATTRWLVAILENHQQADGSVVLPEELARFVGTDVLKPNAKTQ